MADIAGKPMLFHVVDRVKQTHSIDLVTIATSTHTDDDIIEIFCQEEGIPCFRGSPNDVLDRYYQAASYFAADIIVRLTADCPLLDPAIIDKVIQAFHSDKLDYVANVLEYTFPDGLDTEVFSHKTLERTWQEANLKSEREHVTPYIYNHRELFGIGMVKHDVDLSQLRWTVDEPEDLEFVRSVYKHMNSTKFGMSEILDLLQQYPELNKKNADIMRNMGYLKSIQEDSRIDNLKEKKEGTGQKLYQEARKLIPGGTQLLSKRPEIHLPGLWPSYYSKAKGVDVWDLDGNRFIDMSYNGIGACLLGVGDPEVDAAVRAAIEGGSMSTLNCPEEVELAKLLCELHPWADMVRYARGGGEAVAVAVRIARAHTGRDMVAFCEYHGWHDWYLSANLSEESALDGHLLPGLEPAGVPRGLLGTALPFRYNRVEELQEIVKNNRGQIAAIVMEPIRDQKPMLSFYGGHS